VALQFIQPRNPIQNAHIESFNGKFRNEWLNQHRFLSLTDARFHIEQYRRRYYRTAPTKPASP
jgi:putative transposase